MGKSERRWCGSGRFILSTGETIDCTKNASAGALIHRQQTSSYWTFTETKLSSIYRHKPVVTHWALMKSQALFNFFTFQSRRLWRNPRKRVARGGKL